MEPGFPDRHAMRAARSLYTNRQRQAVIDGRIERAASTLASYLALSGLTRAILGLYEVSVDDGELAVSRLAGSGGRQLPLPEPGDQPIDPSGSDDDPSHVLCPVAPHTP